MAKKKLKDEKPGTSAQKKLARIRDRYKVMTEADQENRRDALEDLRFANEPGAQWEENMKKERGNRPCYEFNKCRINGKKVINEIRANRPQGKVRAVEGGDKDTAELYEGLIRNIWNVSDGDTVTDQAAEYQVDAGMAAWRIVTEYSDDDAFDQDVIVKPFKNPFCVYSDPACQDIMKRDAEDWLITERISKSSYQKRWPKAEIAEFEEGVEFDDEDEWESDETVRICEYWYKEPFDKEILLFKTPEGKTITVDSETDEAKALAADGIEPVKRRKVRAHKIKMCIASGTAILEEAEWAGSQFPFVMIYGEYKVIDGEVKWWGLHRFAKDAQRSYNTSRTAIDETIALAPQAKWWATAKQAEGVADKWAIAHQQNFPWMPYNADPMTNGLPPQRMGGADVPAALLQQAVVSAQDIRDVTGLHEASFGEESGEKSGVALARKQNQAQIVTYNFPDNMAKGIRRTWEILVDLIPEIYDAEREMRIIGSDGAEKYEKVNTVVIDPNTQQAIRVNDLTTGKYDVVVTTGPNFSTMRQEAAEVYGDLATRNPEMMQVAGDLIFKSLDYPYADEIAKRWQTILPPAIQQQLTEGKDIPPEVQAAMAQANQAMQQVEQQGQVVQQASIEVDQKKAQAESAEAQVQKAISDFKVLLAQADANATKQAAALQAQSAALVKKEADLAIREARLEMGQQMVVREAEKVDTEAVDVSTTKNVVEDLGQSITLMAQAMAQMQQMMGQVQQMASRKPSRIVAKRVNGALIATPEYDEQMMMQ